MIHHVLGVHPARRTQLGDVAKPRLVARISHNNSVRCYVPPLDEIIEMEELASLLVARHPRARM